MLLLLLACNELFVVRAGRVVLCCAVLRKEFEDIENYEHENAMNRSITFEG